MGWYVYDALTVTVAPRPLLAGFDQVGVTLIGESAPSRDVVAGRIAGRRARCRGTGRAAERVGPIDDRVARALTGRVVEDLVIEDEPPRLDDPEQEQEEHGRDEGEFDERLAAVASGPHRMAPPHQGPPGERSMSVMA
jgi:hypothetical protein